MLQLCPTLCNPIDGSPHQAPPPSGFPRQEHWSGLPFPSPMHACMLSRFSCVWLCATLWTAAHQAPLSTGFSRQEHWSGLPFPSPGDCARGRLYSVASPKWTFVYFQTFPWSINLKRSKTSRTSSKQESLVLLLTLLPSSFVTWSSPFSVLSLI